MIIQKKSRRFICARMRMDKTVRAMDVSYFPVSARSSEDRREKKDTISLKAELMKWEFRKKACGGIWKHANLAQRRT
jgi:hypothetical protein